MISLGAISKIYGVPGWRLGWIIVYNRGGYFDEALVRMRQASMIWLHPCSIIQHALIKILKETPESHFTNTCTKLKEASEIAFKSLSDIRGLKPVKAKGKPNHVNFHQYFRLGAMYMMCQIDLDEFEDIKDDIDFCKKLLAEEC